MFGRNYEVENLLRRAMGYITNDHPLPIDLCVELDRAGIDINSLLTAEWQGEYIEYQKELGFEVIRVH